MTTNALNNSIQGTRKISQWLFDCGAIDIMMEKNDFVTTLEPSKKMIQSANGNLSQVQGGGAIELSSSKN